MSDQFVAIGFFKNDRRFLGFNSTTGTCVVVNSPHQAVEFDYAEEAAIAALVMSLRFNLAHCRAVLVSEAMNVQPS